MLKDKTVWILFFALTVLVTACSEPASTSNKMYDAGGIREALNDFDSDDPKAKEILYGKEIFDKTNVVLPDHVGTELSCMSCHGDGGLAHLTKQQEWRDGFIQNNMPKGQGGTLTDQEAADLAAFLLSHERPIPDTDVVGDYHKDPDRDYMTEERRKKVRNKTFDWSELDSVVLSD